MGLWEAATDRGRSDTSLEQLNDLIQAAFGWLGGHLWVFTTADDDFGPADAELGFRDAARPTLATVVPRAGDRLRYTYDFGDDWQHDIVVEQVATADPAAAYPRCLGGRRAAPPTAAGSGRTRSCWRRSPIRAIPTTPSNR